MPLREDSDEDADGEEEESLLDAEETLDALPSTDEFTFGLLDS